MAGHENRVAVVITAPVIHEFRGPPSREDRAGLKGPLEGVHRGLEAGHLDDVVERRAKFQNELIIASHFSTRYSAKRIRDVVGRVVPDMLDGRLQLWL